MQDRWVGRLFGIITDENTAFQSSTILSTRITIISIPTFPTLSNYNHSQHCEIDSFENYNHNNNQRYVFFSFILVSNYFHFYFLLGVIPSMNVPYWQILIFLEGTPVMGFRSILRFISVVFKVCLCFIYFFFHFKLERTYLFLLSCLYYNGV